MLPRMLRTLKRDFPFRANAILSDCSFARELRENWSMSIAVYARGSIFSLTLSPSVYLSTTGWWLSALDLVDLSASHLRKFQRVVAELKELHRKYSIPWTTLVSSCREDKPLGLSASDHALRRRCVPPFLIALNSRTVYCLLSFATFAPRRTGVTINRDPNRSIDFTRLMLISLGNPGGW